MFNMLRRMFSVSCVRTGLMFEYVHGKLSIYYWHILMQYSTLCLSLYKQFLCISKEQYEVVKASQHCHLETFEDMYSHMFKYLESESARKREKKHYFSKFVKLKFLLEIPKVVMLSHTNSKPFIVESKRVS